MLGMPGGLWQQTGVKFQSVLWARHADSCAGFVVPLQLLLFEGMLESQHDLTVL